MANRYRFGIGTKVECDVGERDHVGGVIVAINYREDYWPEGQTVPYQVRLNDGRLIYAPQDDDRLIRKASNHVIHSLLQDMDEDGLRAQCKPMVALRMKEERAKQVQQLNAPSRIGEPPIVCLFKRERDVEWILTAAEILRNGGADMGAMDRQQTTFLHSAARKGQPALLDFCLKVLESAEEYDLDINAPRLAGKRVHVRSVGRSPARQEVLVWRGGQSNGCYRADRAGAQRHGKSAAACCVHQASDPNPPVAADRCKSLVTARCVWCHMQPLHAAIKHEHTDFVLGWLQLEDVNVNTIDCAGDTPLTSALENGMLTVAQKLIDAGADIGVQSKSLACGSIVHHYASRGNVDVLKMVTSAANFDPAILKQRGGKLGFTPLHLAARGGREQMCRFLLPLSDVSATDNSGKTPAQLAHVNRKNNTHQIIEDFVASR
jgi:ankyrin repeat protein